MPAATRKRQNASHSKVIGLFATAPHHSMPGYPARASSKKPGHTKIVCQSNDAAGDQKREADTLWSGKWAGSKVSDLAPRVHQ